MSDSDSLVLERHGPVWVLRLNRPHVLNAIDQPMRDHWIEFLAGLRTDPQDCRVLVITGTGRSFCSGGDVTEQTDYMGPTAHDGWWGQYRYQELVRLMHDLPIPVVCAVNGIALGGGTAVALMADFRVASEDSVFAVGQIVRGLVPDVALTYMLPRMVGVSRALELMLFETQISAHRALELGLVNWVVPSDQVLPKAIELGQELASRSGPAVEWTKRITYEGLDSSFDTSLRLESMAQGIVANRPEFIAGNKDFKARSEARRSARRQADGAETANSIVVGRGEVVSGGPVSGVFRRVDEMATVMALVQSHAVGDTIVYVPTASVTNLAPIISQLRGILSAAGGPTSHLAIVARGFNVTCVCGVALEGSLDDFEGRRVEVDASGVVRLATESH